MRSDGFKLAIEHLMFYESKRTPIQREGSKLIINGKITINTENRQVLIHETNQIKRVRDGETKVRILEKLHPYLNIRRRIVNTPGENQKPLF